MNFFKQLRQPEPVHEDEDTIEGERALVSVNKGLSLQNKVINWMVIGGACAVALVVLFKYYSGMFRQYEESKAAPKDVTHAVSTATLPPLSMPDPQPVKTSVDKTAIDKLPPLQPSLDSRATGVTSTGQSQMKTEADLIRDRRLKRELRFNLDGGITGATPATSVADIGPAPTPTDASDGATAAAATASNLKAAHSSRFSAARAYALPDPTLMMTRGKVIPCTVQPAMDTTLTGMVTCITADDATGADGKVSLMDRGTLCVGQQGGGVTHGQRRVGIIWQRCETPQHVLVPLLDSNATDALGRVGIAGEVENHFWDRFGAAIALSLISNIGPYLVATRQGGGSNSNNTILFPNIVNGPQELMSEVLKSTADIPPTITAPQAQRVLIYVAGDIDFRDVYQLERSK
jgi:type IV secretion system protein VirB10